MDIKTMAGGEVEFWIPPDGGAIHFKAVTSYGDPVELSADEARDIGQALLRMADVLDDG